MRNGLRLENLDGHAYTGDEKTAKAVQRPVCVRACEIGMDTFQPEARKGLDPDFVDDRLSAGDFPPINGGLAGHNRRGLYYVNFLLVVVDLYDPLPDNVLNSIC